MVDPYGIATFGKIIPLFCDPPSFSTWLVNIIDGALTYPSSDDCSGVTVMVVIRYMARFRAW